MAAEFYRTPLFGRRFAALVRLRRTRLQRLDATPNGCQRAPEMRLELLQLLHRICLGLPDDLVGLGLGVFDDLSSVPLSSPQDLVRGGRLLRSLAGAGHDTATLDVRLSADQLTLRYGPCRRH